MRRASFTLDDLQSIARKVIGDPSITLRPEFVATDVPGWDSLNHTLIIMEICDLWKIALPPNRAARARNFEHLIRMVTNQLNRIQ